VLEGLDDVDCGNAAGVPALVRGLISPDEQTWRGALERLWDAIYHQGDVYEITPFVIPFLVELLDHEVKCRADLLG
jgi:hypothetical protein